MAQLLPITLSGDNLGQRHRYLNSLVDQTATDAVTFQNIEDLPEQAPIDRLFKIDLAIKLKIVDYILKNIKDDDMLYVSRALKCNWLLEDSNIINPTYLEDVLYPEMVLPAISKMKHWLYINLRDPLICQEFYLYYKDTKFDYAIKFFCHCGNEFIFSEFPNIMTKLTPHYLKVLGEKDPKLIKMYYDSMATNNDLIKRYLREEQVFYNNIKCVLKLDPDMFLDITEKYHSMTTYNMFSPTATEYILRFHKNRFTAKPELYVAHLLHMPTVAKCLSSEECQEVVIMLARADFLKWWFSYPNVEPLVKRISPDQRAAFKKRVFVDKDVGEQVVEWPYALPASPVAVDSNLDEPHVFQDNDFKPILMVQPKRKIMKKKGRKAECLMIMSEACTVKSELQKLFDEFRFSGFERTLHELKERVRSTSSADRRRDMLIVLVSKSGGRTDAVKALLQHALSLRNEPVHVRAAVIRSLVKRANVWRLPQDVWDSMLEYSNGLGLDGSKPEAECREGLHAAVMRQLIATGDCGPRMRTAFFEDFTTFAEYKLVESERVKIGVGLQNILVSVAAEASNEDAANYLSQLLDVLEEYHMRFESSPAVSGIVALAERDFEAARSLLERLYKARVGRRELLRQYLKLRLDDAALLNALRHEPQAITPEWLVELLLRGQTRAYRFLTKLGVYFTENGGAAEQIRQAILNKIAEEPEVKLAQPLAILAGFDLISIWEEQDVTAGDHSKLAAALRVNIHHARPAPDALTLGWRKVGIKGVAWRAMRCRPAQVTKLVQSLLEEKVKRTVRLALALAYRTDCMLDVFSKAIVIHPLATLRAALLYFHKLGDACDLKIWDIVKSLISTANLGPCEGLRHMLEQVDWVPKAIKPDYCAILYLAFDKISDRMADYILNDLMNVLPAVTDDLLNNVLVQMMENLERENPKSYPAIFMRYLMLSKNANELEMRFGNIAKPFLNKLDAFRDGTVESTPRFFSRNYDQILSSLLYNSAFFDAKYECCFLVMEKVLTWMQKFMPKEINFADYVKLHATMLYYKAIRQSLKQRPEVFEDPVKKMCEGVEVVGYTYGRYIVKEVTDLIPKYFDTVIEIYRNTLVDYLNRNFTFSISREKFTSAIVKGILSESVGRETRLAVHVLRECQLISESPAVAELKELIAKKEDNETKFFLHAEIFA